MKNALRFVAGLALVVLLQGEEVIFEDHFNGRLGEGWSWVRETPGAWRIRDGALEFRILPGNLWGGANDARNVLVRTAPDPAGDEIEITVKVENQPTGQYEQVNVAWYYDDSHMVKLGREIVDGPVCLVMGREERDQCRTIAQPPVAGGWYRLRLIVSGNRIRGLCLPEGATKWIEAGSCDLPVPAGGKAKISLHSYNGVADREHWARLTEFRVVRRPRPAAAGQ